MARAAVENTAAAEAPAPQPATPIGTEARKPASPDYYAIVAGAIVGLTHNTATTRRAFYDHARRIVEARLRGIEPALPADAVAAEMTALERAIQRIEAEQIEAAFKNVTDAPSIRPVEASAPEPALRVPVLPPAPRRTAKAPRLPGGALVRAFVLMAVAAMGLFAYWLSNGRLKDLNGSAPQAVAVAPTAETAPGSASEPSTATATPAPAPASAPGAEDAPLPHYLRALTDRLAICDPATAHSDACANLRPAPPDLAVPGTMPSWVAANASLASLRPPGTVTQWPNISGGSPLAPGGDAAAASITSGKIVSGPAREKFEAGKARLAADDVEGAIADFGQAIRLQPEFDDARLARGQAYFKAGNVERAIADFNAALEIDPRSFAAYKARGMAFLYNNRTDDALVDLTRAIQFAALEPESIPAIDLFYARRSRATLYDRKQLYDREIIDLTAMIEEYGKNPELAAALKASYGDDGTSALVAALYKQRAHAYLQRNNFDGAVGDLSRAIRLDRAHRLQYLVERARVQEHAGHRKDAAADYKQALALNPKSDDLRNALARVQKP